MINGSLGSEEIKYSKSLLVDYYLHLHYTILEGLPLFYKFSERFMFGFCIVFKVRTTLFMWEV